MRKNIVQAEEGGVLLVVALAAMAVIGATGVAVDIGRGQMVQAKLQNSVDAAGLAAGSTLNTSDLTAVATKYIALNFAQGNLGATLGTVTSSLSQDKQVLTVNASATLPTTLMKIFGNNSMTVNATTEVTRASMGMEVSLVLDITGSMWTSNNYIKQREAAAAMINVLYGDRETVPNLWVSVVPYVTSVNISSQSKATQWLTNYDLSRYPAGYPAGAVKWKGCVEERATPLDVSDDAPVAGTGAAEVATRWNMFFWSSTGPATQNVNFASNPVNNQTLSINGVTWTFVTGAPTTNQTRIGANLNTTLTSLATDLMAARVSNPALLGANYVNSGGTRLAITNVGDNTWLNTLTNVVTINEAVNYQNSGASGGLGPNISCGDPVLPLTASKTTVLNKINSLHPWRKGGTMSNVGLAWGWRMISPKWRGLWDADLVGGQVKLPMDYNTPLMQKVLIIETDGINNFFKSASTTPPYSDYSAMLRLNTTANGGRADINTTSNATGIAALNAKTTALCNAIKAQGVLIYTVTFGLGNSADENTARNLFRNCATDPSYYFDVDSGVPGATQVDLTTAFKTIGDSLANLRISK
jgi:Flp pilus assembly protein TadG